MTVASRRLLPFYGSLITLLPSVERMPGKAALFEPLTRAFTFSLLTSTPCLSLVYVAPKKENKYHVAKLSS